MKILLARHGQSRWQVEGDVVGNDAPLTSLGVWQAHRLGEHIRTYERVVAVVCSDMQRARQTAEIAAGYLDMPVVVEPDLREYEAWHAGWAPLPPSMWETRWDAEIDAEFARFRRRVGAAVRRVVERYADVGTPLLVAHGGTIGVILRILLGSDTPRLWASNTALHAVEWSPEGRSHAWYILYLNNQEHLPRFLRTD